MEGKHLSLDEIKELYGRGDFKGILRLFSLFHPTDVARLLDRLTEEEMLGVFRLLKEDVASAVLLELEGPRRELITSSISKKELVQLVDEMETDDAADVISELPSDAAKEILEGIEIEESIEVRKLLKYPEDTAGGKMRAELVSVRDDFTVKEAVEEVRKKGKELENIPNLFVVSADGRLVGVVPLDKLILVDENQSIRSIINTKQARVTTDVDQEEVAKMFRRYDLLSMPVVDRDNRLVGCITVDDVVDVIEDEIFEDFYRMASLNTGERVLDNSSRSFRLRAPWLLLNLATAFLAASVVKVFEGTIESLVILAVLMPVVAGMGGNAATQTITVVIRGFALGELQPKYAKRLLIKEVLVGMANGVLTGIVAGGIAYLFGANIMIGVLLFLAMTINLMIAGFSGCIIPLILRWLGYDPALSASVFVTTCTDVGGFFSFLGLAAIFMKLGIL